MWYRLERPKSAIYRVGTSTGHAKGWVVMALGHPLSRSWGKPSPDRRKDTPNPHLIAQVLKDSALRPSIGK